MNLIEGENSKVCSRCQELKHFNNYYKDKHKEYNVYSSCKKCVSEKRPRKEKTKEQKQKLARKRRLKTLLQNSIERNYESFRDKLIKHKFCTKCNLYKSFNNYNKIKNGYCGLQSWCKKCTNKNSLAWYENNKRHVNKKQRKRLIDNPHIRMVQNIRSRLNKILNNEYKKDSTVKLLGCTIKGFRKHIEEQFVDGMSWDNYGRGGWHLDHIVSISNWDLTCPYQQSVAFHYTNCRPLWEKDNLKRRKTAVGLNLNIKITKSYLKEILHMLN